jgi:hypothetical protein
MNVRLQLYVREEAASGCSPLQVDRARSGDLHMYQALNPSRGFLRPGCKWSRAAVASLRRGTWAFEGQLALLMI